MGEPIHIRAQVSFAVMKIQVPIILQEFPFKKNNRNTKRSGRSKVTLNSKTSGYMGIFDHWGMPKQFSSDCLVTESQKSIANAVIF